MFNNPATASYYYAYFMNPIIIYLQFMNPAGWVSQNLGNTQVPNGTYLYQLWLSQWMFNNPALIATL